MRGPLTARALPPIPQTGFLGGKICDPRIVRGCAGRPVCCLKRLCCAVRARCRGALSHSRAAKKNLFSRRVPYDDVPIRPARRRGGRSPHLVRAASHDAGEVTANQRMRVGLMSKFVRSVEQCTPQYLNSGTVLEHAQGSTASHKSASKPTCGGSAAAHGAASLRWKGDWRRQVPTTLHCA